MTNMGVTLCVGVLLAACGGGGNFDDSAPREPSLDGGFAGAWSGPVRMSATGAAPWNINATVDVYVHGDSITISGLCPDGSGVMTTRGEDESAAWTGAMECMPIDRTCKAEMWRFTHASIRLVDGNTLDVGASGRTTGCSEDANVALTFTGRRP